MTVDSKDSVAVSGRAATTSWIDGRGVITDYPEMSSEPPRVQPSKKVEANWEEDGNPVAE